MFENKIYTTKKKRSNFFNRGKPEVTPAAQCFQQGQQGDGWLSSPTMALSRPNLQVITAPLHISLCSWPTRLPAGFRDCSNHWSVANEVSSQILQYNLQREVANWQCLAGWLWLWLGGWLLAGWLCLGWLAVFRWLDGWLCLVAMADCLWQAASLAGWAGGYIEDWKNQPRYVGITINHEIRIPIKQPGFNGK